MSRFSTTLNLIGSCLVLIFSISLTLYYSISLQIKYDLCRLNGYLINSFFHGIIYSYVLLNMNTFYAKTCRLSKCSQIMQICFQWILAFVLSYLSHEYEFQFKGRFCFFRTKFSLIQNFSTSLILPIVVNILLNSLIYFYIQQRRTSNPNHINYQQTTSLYQQISRRLYQRQNQKYLQLMRQTLIILFVGCLVWGSFHLLSLIDHNKIVPDDVYLLVLSFPSICLLIQTLLIQSWHKLTKKSLRTTKNLRTFSSTTTVRFSQSINPNHVDLF